MATNPSNAVSQPNVQLIGLARQLVQNHLLDEATASVDTETERQIQAALDRLMEGRTSIVIAHRLSTVRNADRILVFDNGKLVAQGTHGELVKKNALYARLAKLQFSAPSA